MPGTMRGAARGQTDAAHGADGSKSALSDPTKTLKGRCDSVIAQPRLRSRDTDYALVHVLLRYGEKVQTPAQLSVMI